MTQPEPTPVAPANPPAPPAAPEPGTLTPPATPPAPAPFDPTSLTPEAKRYLDEQIAAADKKARTTSKENAASEARTALLAEIAEKLGLGGEDGPPDPAKLTEQIEAQQAALWKSDTEKQMLRLGNRVGIDVDALMDSSRGMDALAEALDKRADITDLDPNGPEFAKELERALGEVAEQFPRFKVSSTPRPDPTQGSRGNPAADLDAQITLAEKENRWQDVIALKRQKFAKSSK